MIFGNLGFSLTNLMGQYQHFHNTSYSIGYFLHYNFRCEESGLYFLVIQDFGYVYGISYPNVSV